MLGEPCRPLGYLEGMTHSLATALIVPATEAEGPGRRFAVWLQGCPLRCAGCCNPEMLSFEGGTAIDIDHLASQVFTAQREHGVEGITLLGGEPFSKAVGAARLAELVRDAGLSVMVFSGYTLGELYSSNDAGVVELLAATDILVDGPYMRDLPETRRRWIGSSNQQIHFLSDRYQADDPRWLLPNTLEIRLADGELTVNGFPARQGADFWRRLPQKARG